MSTGWTRGQQPICPSRSTSPQGLSKVFGYSLSLLRISTVLMSLCGVIAFYRILKDSGSDGAPAAALTVALICSPLVLWLSFTFMTDVQFLGWVLIACWMYAKGIRLDSLNILILGGIAASLAIGTRQFGVALPAGLVFAWLTSKRHNRPRASAILAAVTVPSAAFLWQLWAARDHPNFTQSVRLIEQSVYLRQPAPLFVLQLLWRSTVVAEYAGLYLAALIPGLLMQMCNRRTKSPTSWGLPLGVWSGYLISGQLISALGSKGAFLDRVRAALIPTIPWVISLVIPNRIRYQLILSLLGLTSAIILGRLLFQDFALMRAWHHRDTVTCFFVGAALAFAVLHLLYVQLNDTYLIIFLPFILFALAQLVRTRNARRSWIQTTAVCSTIAGIAMAFWLRGDLNRQEAIWQASEKIHAAGVDTMQIRGSLAWTEYHSAFDEWLIHLGPRARPEDYSGPYRLHDPFYAWLTEMQKRAEYIIYASERLPDVAGYDVTGRVPYRDSLMRPRFVYIIKRKAI